ncbi:hypothetical protein PWT90_02476 [Aphanocladium album]|nr:hypothetical protein PWT90_02476 [Aphanocladium album]
MTDIVRSSRRVKCDEAKPICGRCARARLDCRGFRQAASPGTSVGVMEGYGRLRISGFQWYKQGIVMEAEPPEWEYMQAIHVYYSIIKPTLVSDVHVVTDPPFNTHRMMRPVFIIRIICSQISNASKSRCRMIEIGQDPAFAGLWASYYRYLDESLRIVNRCIGEEGRESYESSLSNIAHMVYVDLYTKASLWQAHIRGFFAYIELRGGIAVAIKQPSLGMDFINAILCGMIWLNTTTPAAQRLRGVDSYDDDQLRTVIDFDSSVTMPCPPEYTILIHHITRLREVFAHVGADSTVQDGAQQFLASKLKMAFMFDLEGWVKAKYEGSIATSMATALANIHEIAIRLYAILTLPKYMVMKWSRSMPNPLVADQDLHEQSVYERLRIGHRCEILTRVRRIRHTLTAKQDVTWPLIVAGVAAGDASEKDREFIMDALLETWMATGSSVSFILARDKVRAFWKSGRTGWEECFDEPTPSIPSWYFQAWPVFLQELSLDAASLHGFAQRIRKGSIASMETHIRHINISLAGFDDWASPRLLPRYSTANAAFVKDWTAQLNKDLSILARVFSKLTNLRAVFFTALPERIDARCGSPRSGYLSGAATVGLIRAEHLTSLDIDAVGSTLSSKSDLLDYHPCHMFRRVSRQLRRLRIRIACICPDILRVLCASAEGLVLEDVVVNLSICSTSGHSTSYKFPMCCVDMPWGFDQLQLEMEAQATQLARALKNPRIVRVLSHGYPGPRPQSFDAVTGRRMVLAAPTPWDADGEELLG